MFRRKGKGEIGLGLGILLALCPVVVPVSAQTEILPGSVGTLDSQTVDAVVAVFHKADEAVHNRDLDAVMALYSEQYNYHGLRKADIRKVWADLFDEYREISDRHLFSKIAKTRSGSMGIIEITCTGSLSGISTTSGLHIPIDSWYEETHYLALEDGVWRIRGNAGEAPRVLPFGTAPHPLF